MHIQHSRTQQGIAAMLLTTLRNNKTSATNSRNKAGSIMLSDSYFKQNDLHYATSLRLTSKQTLGAKKFIANKIRNICYRHKYSPSLDVNTKDESAPLFLFHTKSKCNKTSCMQSTNTVSPSKLSRYLYGSSLRNYRILKTYEGTKMSHINWYGSKSHMGNIIKLASISNRVVV